MIYSSILSRPIYWFRWWAWWRVLCTLLTFAWTLVSTLDLQTFIAGNMIARVLISLENIALLWLVGYVVWVSIAIVVKMSCLCSWSCLKERVICSIVFLIFASLNLCSLNYFFMGVWLPEHSYRSMVFEYCLFLYTLHRVSIDVLFSCCLIILLYDKRFTLTFSREILSHWNLHYFIDHSISSFTIISLLNRYVYRIICYPLTSYYLTV